MAKLSEVNSQVSPMEANVNNSLIPASEGYKVDADDVTAFKSGLGQLIYLMVRTCSDIAFALCKLSTFSNNPTDTHWKVLKRVLRYLADTRESFMGGPVTLYVTTLTLIGQETKTPLGLLQDMYSR